MKKVMVILAICIVGCVATLYGKKIRQVIIKENTVSKTVCFSISPGTDYSASIYKGSKAKVHLSIYSYKGEDRELVWEGLVDEGSVSNYGSHNKNLYRQVTIHNVSDRYETLAAYYEVLYNTKGSKFSYSEGLTLSTGTSVDSMQVVM